LAFVLRWLLAAVLDRLALGRAAFLETLALLVAPLLAEFFWAATLAPDWAFFAAPVAPRWSSGT
jgi:predicted benzoate:H+ symporter BenE